MIYDIISGPLVLTAITLTLTLVTLALDYDGDASGWSVVKVRLGNSICPPIRLNTSNLSLIHI